MVAAAAAELHPAIVALLKDAGLFIQHTHQDRDNLVRFLKKCLNDAKVALNLRVAYHGNLKMFASIGFVPKEGDEAVDPLAFLKFHIHGEKGKVTVPLTKVGRRRRVCVHELPSSNLSVIFKPSSKAKWPASSSAGTPQAGRGKGKASMPAGLHSTPAPASPTERVTSDDSVCTAERVHQEVMAEGYARDVPRISSQEPGKIGQREAHQFN